MDGTAMEGSEPPLSPTDLTRSVVLLCVLCVLQGVSWSVNRRYNAFNDLHAGLKKVVAREKDLPPLPGKHIFSRTDTSEAIEKRRIELTGYLQSILKVPSLARSEVLAGFLVGTFYDLFLKLKQ
jgi:hypothetical protein